MMAYEQRPNTGSLFRNDKKEPGDSKPDYTGSANLNGQNHWLDAWLNESANGTKYMSVKFKPKDATNTVQKQGGYTGSYHGDPATNTGGGISNPPAPADLDDDVPF